MEFVILKTKDWVKEKGMFAYRVVLTVKTGLKKEGHQLNANLYAEEYTTHIQIDNGEKKYLASGHYFMDMESALKDFKDRVY